MVPLPTSQLDSARHQSSVTGAATHAVQRLSGMQKFSRLIDFVESFSFRATTPSWPWALPLYPAGGTAPKPPIISSRAAPADPFTLVAPLVESIIFPLWTVVPTRCPCKIVFAVFSGGMGTAYSLPRSPDDYLSNVDEMDLQEDCECTFIMLMSM